MFQYLGGDNITTKSLEAPPGILDRGSASRSLNMLDNPA